AWSPSLEPLWFSEPHSTHSRNVRANPSAAVAVYDSNQSWGRPDRGIQLFGRSREQAGKHAQDAERIYTKRFPDYAPHASTGYRSYRSRPTRVTLFDALARDGSPF